MLNASLTCYSVFFLAYCVPPVVCVDVFSDECAALSRMSLHQPFVRAHLCLWSNVLSPLLLSPSIPRFPTLSSPPSLSLSHTRCTSTCNISCTCACMHTHTPLACHLVGSLISSSLVVFAPSFSAYNSPSYPPFLALSITDHDLTRQN